MSITLNGTTGIDAPAVTLPEGAVQSQLDTKLDDADALALFNASGSAPVYACRAWVNFNGTGTVAIRASGNVSSITDGGAGLYYANFTTAMPDLNSAVTVAGRTMDSLNGSFCTASANIDHVTIECWGNTNLTRADNSSVSVSIFR